MNNGSFSELAFISLASDAYGPGCIDGGSGHIFASVVRITVILEQLVWIHLQIVKQHVSELRCVHVIYMQCNGDSFADGHD